MATASDEGTFAFGPHSIDASQVFLQTPLCLALVNLRPVVPGHVLVIPRRLVPRFGGLTPAEVCDLWLTVQRVSRAMEAFHGSDACSIALQDGPAAGQTVPHVHVHVLPRHRDDLADNDEVYTLIEESGPGQRPGHFSSLREEMQRSKALAVDPSALSAPPAAAVPSAPTAHCDSAARAAPLPGDAQLGSPTEECAVMRGRPHQIPVCRHPRTGREMAAEAAVYRALEFV